MHFTLQKNIIREIICFAVILNRIKIYNMRNEFLKKNRKIKRNGKNRDLFGNIRS